MFTEITRIELWQRTDAGDEELFATIEGGGLVRCGEDGNEAGIDIYELRLGLETLFNSIYGSVFDVRFPELGE